MLCGVNGITLHDKLTFEVIKVQDKSKTTGAANLPGMEATGYTTPRPPKAVLIIGGGIGGCMSAWKAAENGWDVTIIERGADLLLGSSNQTPGRMGLGFHYSDVDTAKRLLRATINFVKEFPGFERGRDKHPNHPVKNGRYYVVNESLVDVDGITDTYFELVNYYKELTKQDKANRIYGDPKRFLRVLEEENYAGIINTNIVAEAYETCEPLLDWGYFREDFLRKLKQHPRIKIILNATVTKPEYLDNGDYKLNYTQSIASESDMEKFCISTYVINCTWQNSESLDVQLGFVEEDALNRVNRLKVIATVDLPPALYEMHSAFFLTGAHAMVTNKFDTTADMSYAEVTNVANFRGLTIDSAWTELLEGKYDDVDIDIVMPDIKRYLAGESVKTPIPEELKAYLKMPKEQWNPKEMLDIYYGCRIRDGVAKYVPKMALAKVTAVKFGIVKTRGDNVDLNDPKSDIHKRDYSGVTVHRVGWITNECMKLLYGVENGNEVLGLLNQHYSIDCEILSRIHKTLERYQHDSVKMQEKIDTLRFDARLNYLDKPRTINPGADERAYSAHSSTANSRAPSNSNSGNASSGTSPEDISPREDDTAIKYAEKLSPLRKSPSFVVPRAIRKNSGGSEDSQEDELSKSYPPDKPRFRRAKIYHASLMSFFHRRRKVIGPEEKILEKLLVAQSSEITMTMTASPDEGQDDFVRIPGSATNYQ
jgi:hypothetical protein